MQVSPREKMDALNGHELEQEIRTGARHGMRPLIPMALLAFALLAGGLFQTIQLLLERGNLHSARNGQQKQLEESVRLRAALDSIATDTEKLAELGNPNAKLIVDELRKRGITINSPAQANTESKP